MMALAMIRLPVFFSILFIFFSTLTGCGGGASTTANTAPNSVGVSLVPDTIGQPGSQDVQSYKINVWNNLWEGGACVECHVAGEQAPEFAQLDINAAYDLAVDLVDTENPGLSRMVTKVRGGHNCWLASADACGDIIQTYIETWLADGGISSRAILLTAPDNIRDPGTTKVLPQITPPEFSAVHNILTQHCADCHTDTSATPQSPFFAVANIDTAYEAARSKIDPNDTQNIVLAQSRLVVRLRDEFHNCWSGNCADDALDIHNAIQGMADQITPQSVDSNLVISKALTLGEGIIASGGKRHESNQIALWEFKTGSGNTAYDTSGVNPALNLSLSNGAEWVGGYGIRFAVPTAKAKGTTDVSAKLYDKISITGEYSIEAWASPANVTQEDARMVSYSGAVDRRNFMMGQTLYSYDFYQRGENTDANGGPALTTAVADEDAQATLQHVVMTYDPVNGRKVYVDGVDTGDFDSADPGSPTGQVWSRNYALVLGNEVSGTLPWSGTLRLVAIHDRALTAEQVQTNFAAGVGEKYFLLFAVTQLVDPAFNPNTDSHHAFIMFEVSQFDSYSYLFNKATFISLDQNFTPTNIPLNAMRIGINGKEAVVGQAYRHIDVMLDGVNYTPADGQRLSDIGTIIVLENGPASDEFFLSFEQLGTASNLVLESKLAPMSIALSSTAVSDIGLRTFDEINAAMAVMTGVDPLSVKPVYDRVRQALPSIETIEGFLSAHQMAVTEMSIMYCNALVENDALRNDFFVSGADFNNMNWGNSVQDIFDKMLGLPDPASNVMTSSPSLTEVSTELMNMQSRLCPGVCDAARSRVVLKSMCSAVLGSAAMLVQ